MMLCGIYKIESKIKPCRVYIGSAININKRWIRHKTQLKNNIHNNKKLQNHYNKYGVNDLVFSVLQLCNNNELIKIEQTYLDNNETYFNILNFAYSLSGFKHKEETKKYLSKINKGHKMTPEQNHKNSIAQTGKISWMRGKKFSMEHRKNISEAKKRKVINYHTNEIFNSIEDASNSIGIKYSTLYAWLSNRNVNQSNLKFY